MHDTLGIPMRRLGARSLRGIAEPIEVFAVEVNGQPAPDLAEWPAAPAELARPFTEASVAVLPIASLSDDSRNRHLCDALTGELITNLCRFRDLLVTARHSAFLFRGSDVAAFQIGSQLGVHYLVNGGLLRWGRSSGLASG